jgi:hypothetical protein
LQIVRKTEGGASINVAVCLYPSGKARDRAFAVVAKVRLLEELYVCTNLSHNNNLCLTSYGIALHVFYLEESCVLFRKILGLVLPLRHLPSRMCSNCLLTAYPNAFCALLLRSRTLIPAPYIISYLYLSLFALETASLCNLVLLHFYFCSLDINFKFVSSNGVWPL